MESERTDGTGLGDGLSGSLLGLVSWRASFILGLITLILGVILAFRPAQSLAVIAVLLGVAMMVGGIYHIVRALSSIVEAISGPRGGRGGPGAGWHVFFGIVSLIAGIILVVAPIASVA